MLRIDWGLCSFEELVHSFAVKKIFALIVSAVGCFTALSNGVFAQLPASLSNNLILAYTFDGNYDDSSGNGNNLSNISSISATTNRFGTLNSAIQFDSFTSQATSINNLPLSGNMSRTISLWFKVPSGQPDVTSLFGFGVYGPTSYGTVTGLLPLNYNDPLGPNLTVWGHFAEVQTEPINTIFDKWYNFVYVYQGDVTNSTLYLDGSLIPSYSIPGNNRTNQLNTTMTPLSIGQTGNADDPFLSSLGAQLDDMYFWDRPLSSEEVTELYNAQVVPEPSTYALLLLSGAASLWVLKRRKS